MNMQWRAALGAAVFCLCAQGAPVLGAEQSFVGPKDVKLGPAPPTLPRGAQVAVLNGDPSKSGPFVLRLMLPASYKIGPHWHSQDEFLTVISGTLFIGMGDHFDPATARGLAATGFHDLPGRAHHYAFAKKPTVVQINGVGPFDITDLNAADDPQKAK